MEQWYVCMESRCSPYLIDPMKVIRFNFNFELGRMMLKESVEDRLAALGIRRDRIDKAINIMASGVTPRDFDESHLITTKLVELCKLLKIDPKVLFDEYDRFIQNNYSDTILKYRRINNLSQKDLAKVLSVSPTYILKWETKRTFPSRKQYRNLVKFIN